MKHAIRIRRLVAGKSRYQVEFDEALPFALAALFQIIGEAARNIAEEIRRTNPNVNWKGWIGFRNRIAHGYFEIDFDIMWEAVQSDIPKLIESLESFSSPGNLFTGL